MISNGIVTKQVDGIWWAHLDHEILGPIDGRSGTEAMAISALFKSLREKCQAFNTARYEQLRAKHPNHNWSKTA